MLYLASQFVWFLLAAFALGLAMGWISHDGGKARVWNGAWILIAVLWLGATIMSWSQMINGMASTWVETALLFVASYWLGCVCASLVSKPAAETSVPVLASATPVTAGQAAITAATPAAASSAVNEAEHPGQRPSSLAAAHGGKSDDLKIIKGVGKQNEKRLHGLGVWHFAQIADWTPENVEWVGSYLAFPGRIEREDWVGQAKVLAAGASESSKGT